MTGKSEFLRDEFEKAMTFWVPYFGFNMTPLRLFMYVADSGGVTAYRTMDDLNIPRGTYEHNMRVLLQWDDNPLMERRYVSVIGRKKAAPHYTLHLTERGQALYEEWLDYMTETE